MTNEEVKAWLGRYAKAQRIVSRLQSEYLAFGMKKKYLPRLTDAERNAERILDEIMDVLEQLSCEEEKAVISARYLQLCSWEEVCIVVHYEWAQTHRFHAKALRELSALIQKHDTQ